MKKAITIIIGFFAMNLSFAQETPPDSVGGILTHASGYLRMFPYGTSYDDGSFAKIFYDGNNKIINFWNSGTTYTDLRVGKINGQVVHTNGYFVMHSYSDVYDDESYAKIWYNGKKKEVVFANSTGNTDLVAGKINGALVHTKDYFIMHPYGSAYDDGSFAKIWYNGTKKAIVFGNSVSTANSDVMVGTVFASEKVGIGTTKISDHLLTVNGSIGAKKIVVESGSGWSDFVFEKNYILPTIDEVENHIKENGHLKDIPNAKDVEEKGVNLGEMDAKLLQKIEELTLYMIDLNKRFKNLELENKALKKQVGSH